MTINKYFSTSTAALDKQQSNAVTNMARVTEGIAKQAQWHPRTNEHSICLLRFVKGTLRRLGSYENQLRFKRE